MVRQQTGLDAEDDVNGGVFNARECHRIGYTAHSRLLKWFCLVPFPGSIALAGADKTLIGIGLITSLIAVLFWIYSAWAAIPAEYRVTDSGKAIHPLEAVALLCVPIYNLYWIFVSSRAICDALDNMLDTTSSSRRAPRHVALAASICQLIPTTNVVVAPLLWLWFMFRFDAAARELELALRNSAHET